MKTKEYYELQYFSDSDMIWKTFGCKHNTLESASAKQKEAMRFHTEVYNLETEYRIVKKTIYSEIIKKF